MLNNYKLVSARISSTSTTVNNETSNISKYNIMLSYI